jgi:hypothetical protein
MACLDLQRDVFEMFDVDERVATRSVRPEKSTERVRIVDTHSRIFDALRYRTKPHSLPRKILRLQGRAVPEPWNLIGSPSATTLSTQWRTDHVNSKIHRFTTKRYYHSLQRLSEGYRTIAFQHTILHYA